ncbi:outer membrane beta-barrel protein [Aureibacter tunicatorum]|uniref:Outer membrane protein beta-barrel domain-containing protein n=1 Tax=Aureibacter tunicatorum TaxID=866807 RepID=A0AAE4BS21_9BACT|nr:outer membrane beta-barrel protein [Aureibacter tunicatorum]MDR6238438.1 hypothetical protein [Aureibacter tunicatorum]BDD05628.1 hypothetical protein AUTU_31110 [Aureibacter tunicatorum]
MKKLLCVLFCGIFMIWSHAGFGQAAILALIFGDKVASENFNLSLEIGGNLSYISDVPDGKIAFGVNFGLGANIKLSDKFYLVPQFQPLQPKGNRYKGSLQTGIAELDSLYQDKTVHRRLSYIDVPVYIYYRPIERWRFGIGPKVGFLTKAVDFYENGGNSLELDVKDQLSKTDFGVAVDVMFEVSNFRGGKGVNIHVNYYQGLVELEKGTSRRNGVLGVTLGFPFISDEQLEKNNAKKK